jgi:serine/threonine protein phosphatase PrpC
MNLTNDYQQQADAGCNGPESAASIRCQGCDELLDSAAWFCECCGRTAVRDRVEITVDDELALVSDLGRKRKINQDCGLVLRRQDGNAVMVVADGVSNSWRSERAASLAAQSVAEHLRNLKAPMLVTEAIRGAIAAAHAAIKAQIIPEADSEFDASETTIVVALQDGTTWGLGWVGDSRAYRLSSSTAELLTTDDSWEEAIANGRDDWQCPDGLTSMAGAITQTLGMLDDGLKIHTDTTCLVPGDRLLLCTDGLWGYFESAQALADELPLQGPSGALIEARHMVMRANDRGGKDNVSVAVAIQGAESYLVPAQGTSTQLNNQGDKS